MLCGALLLLAVAVRIEAQELAAFVRRQMDEHGVPGAAVAVIRSNRVVWLGSFGVANTVTREPVTRDTVFPVASNGKPVAAYLAVLLDRRGVLHLDQPVLAQATPRHLLTHSSGLGNFLRDRQRRLAFPPGERFAYSGVGFVVLQELLERRTGRTLDELARTHVFQPANMRRAWYGATPEGITDLAAPHIPLSRALAPFSIVVAPLLLAMAVVLLLVQRWRSGRWRLGWRASMVAVCLAAVIAFAFLLDRSGSWVLAAWFTAVPLIAAAVPATLVVLRRHRGLEVAVVLGIAAAVLFVLRDRPVPLPAGQTGPANAASTLRASAPSLAAFLIELSRPGTLDPAAVRAMTTVSREINAVSAWGLGIGIERHARGRDLWHWGSTPARRAS